MKFAFLCLPGFFLVSSVCASYIDLDRGKTAAQATLYKRRTVRMWKRRVAPSPMETLKEASETAMRQLSFENREDAGQELERGDSAGVETTIEIEGASRMFVRKDDTETRVEEFPGPDNGTDELGLGEDSMPESVESGSEPPIVE